MKAVVKKLHKKSKVLSKKISKVSFSSCFNFIKINNYKPLFTIIVIAFVGFLLYRGVSNSVVVSQSEIIRRISKHVSLPESAPLSVVRVDNAETLRVQNEFYKDINEGDYILAYRTMVVIYDLRNDKVVRITSSR